MSSKKRTEALDRARKAADQLKPMAAQVKPMAKNTGQAARRQLIRTRRWAAPRVERGGKVLEDTIAPKVSAMLSSAAERIDPAKPQRRQWRKPVGIAAAVTAAASAAAAVFRNRMKTATGSPAGDVGATAAGSAGGAADTAKTGTTADTEIGGHQAHVG